MRMSRKDRDDLSSYVCLCRAVTDVQIRTAVARGTRTVDELVGQSGAGTRCGGCRPDLARLLVACSA
jgi:bacterioferritin-associated ferredoxin